MPSSSMANSLAFNSTAAPAVFADGRRKVPASKRLKLEVRLAKALKQPALWFIQRTRSRSARLTEG